MSFFWAYVRLSWLPQHDHGVCKYDFFFCFRAWERPSLYREKISWTPTGAYWTRQEYGYSTHVGKMATQSDVEHFLVGKQVLYQLFHCCSSREVHKMVIQPAIGHCLLGTQLPNQLFHGGSCYVEKTSTQSNVDKSLVKIHVLYQLPHGCSSQERR